MKAYVCGAAIGALVFVQGASSAWGEVLMECGASSGHTFYLKGGLVAPGDEGWEEDRIPDGRIVLSREGSDFDLTYKDVFGVAPSVRSDGGTVVPLSYRAGRLLLLIVHRGSEVTETYLFSFQDHEVAWTQAKSTGLVDKVAAFRASCN